MKSELTRDQFWNRMRRMKIEIPCPECGGPIRVLGDAPDNLWYSSFFIKHRKTFDGRSRPCKISGHDLSKEDRDAVLAILEIAK